MIKVLIDTNVCLDAAQYRKPFAITALKIFARSEKNDFTGFVAAHTFDTLFYILSKTYSKKQTYDALEGLRGTVQICSVDKTVIDKALNLKWHDFEDAIHYTAAQTAGCQAIVTRNKKDFIKGELPVFSPLELLDYLDQQS